MQLHLTVIITKNMTDTMDIKGIRLVQFLFYHNPTRKTFPLLHDFSLNAGLRLL